MCGALAPPFVSWLRRVREEVALGMEDEDKVKSAERC